MLLDDMSNPNSFIASNIDLPSECQGRLLTATTRLPFVHPFAVVVRLVGPTLVLLTQMLHKSSLLSKLLARLYFLPMPDKAALPAEADGWTVVKQ